MTKVTLRKTRETRVRGGHPWIYEAEVIGYRNPSEDDLANESGNVLFAEPFGIENGTVIDAVSENGRYLGTVYLRGVNINGLQVREGMAWAYRRYLDSQDYLRWEEQARSEKRGLWQDPHPVYPSDYRKARRRGIARPYAFPR